VALALPVLSGCAQWGCVNTTAERQEAAVRVQVVDDYGERVGVTAEVLGWRLEPHPQVPAEGDKVSFRYMFRGADPDRGPHPAVDACAVDAERVALGCETVYSSGARSRPEGDGALRDERWLTVEHPERVDAVLLVPNDQAHQPRTCEDDIKDGGGALPPEKATVGDRL
jgi:hypothetical protein